MPYMLRGADCKNRPFSSCFLPLFQNQSTCKKFSYENKFDVYENERAIPAISLSHEFVFTLKQETTQKLGME